MEYIDRILVKLKRKYGKDELVATLCKKVSELELENGKLNSELAHLEHQLKLNVTQKQINKTANIEVRKEELYTLQLNENNKLREENNRLRRYRDELIHEVFVLKNKKYHSKI